MTPPNMPSLILWAWETPQDLSMINTKTTGVAALMLSISITNSNIIYYPRQQPLNIPPNTYSIMVVHISKPNGARSLTSMVDLNQTTIKYMVARIKNIYLRGKYQELQIDFDALGHDHKFYKELLQQLRQELGPKTIISITALASWCSSDRWIATEQLPINYVVPMFFSLSNSPKERLAFITGFRPNNLVTYCNGPIGLATFEKWDVPIYTSNPIFIYNNGSWTNISLQKAYNLRQQHNKKQF